MEKQCVWCGMAGHDSEECKVPRNVATNDNTRPVRLYVAGPMSGLPENNYPAFHAAADQLRELGYLVENPAENTLGDGATWHQYMRAGIKQLMRCDAIVMLPGWTESRGAKTEFMIAVNLDMRAFELDKLLDRSRPYTRREVAA